MLTNPFLNWVEKIYRLFVKIGSNLQSLFLLYMRLTWGHQLMKAGFKKLYHIQETTQMFQELSIPAPQFHVYEVGLIEAIGGLFFLFGFASRIISIPVICVMMMAFGLVHKAPFQNFAFLIDPYTLVIQQPYPILFTALLLFLFGPGRVSIDAWLKRWISHQPRY